MKTWKDDIIEAPWNEKFYMIFDKVFNPTAYNWPIEINYKTGERKPFLRLYTFGRFLQRIGVALEKGKSKTSITK